MNSERLLQHYEQIADAPDAIARLRRFILDLAVRGKLVPQDPADGPASELLKRIVTEKARLVKAGRNGKSKASLSVPSAEMPFSVSNGWVLTRLGDIIVLLSGQHLQPSEYSEVTGAGVPYITGPSDFSANGLSISRYALVRKAVARKGQLLLTVKGSGVGKTTICDLNEVAISRQLMSLTPICWDLGFLEIITHRLAIALQSQARSLIPGIAREDVEDFVFPLPPLAEQHRIVAKVDELMALCDEVEAARKERETKRDHLAAASLARLNTPDPETFHNDARFALDALPALTARSGQIKQLRQTILNLAVRGKLVPQDPADEPAEELLRRLVAAQDAACRYEGLRARPPVKKLGRSDLWFEFPDEWVLSSFDDLFVIVSGVTKGQKVTPSEAKDTPYLRVANVQREHLDLAVIKTISVRRSEAERYALRYGDVLMTEGGDWDKLGRAAIWREEIPNCIHQNHIFRVRPPSADICSEWIITYVNSHVGRAFFEEASKQTTNLASINMTQLRACPFPLPPLAEQHRIVAKVEELMAVCDQLEASLISADEMRKKLLEALLAEALAPADVEALQEAAE